MKRKSKILTGASVAIISFAQIPFTAFADDTPTTYQIWIGSTQVTSENKDDILSDGGSVKFDPEIHLLTFDNPKEINGSTQGPSSWWAVILAYESVTVTGTLNLTKNSNLSQEIAIWCHGTDLILDNFKVSAKGYNAGIASYGHNIKIQNGCDINVNDISGSRYSHPIAAGNKIVIDNSRVIVDNCYTGIASASGSLTINGNNTYVKASNINDGEPIVTKNLTLGDEVQLIKDEANGIYTVKSKNYAWARTYPTNIKFEYNEKYHQGRFTWDRVKNADRYGIAIYYAGMWRTQTQNITTNSYITPKTLKPGATYKVAIAARVNGKWDTANAIRHAVTITIPADSHDYDECIEKIKCMEKYISEYWSEIGSYRNDYMTVCMNLIRIQNPDYDSWKWDLTTGEICIDADLQIMDYINEKDKSCLEYFKNMKDHPFYDDYGNKIDIVHLIATLQGQYNEYVSQVFIDKDLSGWLGDLQSLIYDLKKETYGKNVDLKSKALELIAHDGTYFSADDMYADIDAKNIFCLYDTNNKLSKVLEEYYKNYTSKRFSLFVEKSGGIEAIEKKAKKYTSQSINPSHSILTNAADRVAEDENLFDVYYNTYITDEYGNITYTLTFPNIVSKSETEALTYAFVTYIQNGKNSEN